MNHEQKHARPKQRLSAKTSKRNPDTLKYVVGIGASAGGLDSIEKLIRGFSTNTGSAFIVIQHLSPDAISSMAEILARSTNLRIQMAANGMKLEPDTIYLIPPGDEIQIADGCFTTARLDRDVLTRVIDVFFKSAAEEFGSRMIGIILSGSGSDGAEGVKAIKYAGGTCIAESFETAQFDGMPRSSVATGQIDFVLPPEEIAALLDLKYFNPSPAFAKENELAAEELSGIELVFALLSRRHDIDFSHYKTSTVARRIERRQKICSQLTMTGYADYLKSNLEEQDKLYHDLLIGVTKFFRDSDAFDVIERCVDELVRELPAQDTLRVWSAGCASGEEAYSLAMIVLDSFLRHEKPPNFKVFATDVHKSTLDSASTGVYDSDSLEFVNAQRKQRHFDIEGKDAFRINSNLRRHLVFARHNVFSDPPFTRMHLVSCRNLLIYLKQPAQMRAISSFHFSLNTDGLLILGSSETIGSFADEFRVVDANWKIFQKIRNLPSMLVKHLDHDEQSLHDGPRRLVNILNSDRPESLSFTKLVECYDLVLSEFVESGLILDEHRNVLHVFGDANRFLVSKSGRFSGNISDFLSGDARAAIMATLIRSNRTPGKKIVLQDISLETKDGPIALDIEIRALFGTHVNTLVWFVRFIPHPENRQDTVSVVAETIQHSRGDFEELESELLYTKDSLNATIEELEASNEELQAANEELVASNEELQSTNEELQSVNEELYTVNLENNRKIDELQELTDDLEVLLSTSEVGTLFLDTDLKIRKFTKSVTRHFDLLQHDIGRPIDNFSNRLGVDWLTDKLKSTLETETPFEAELTDELGDRILIRIIAHQSGSKTTGVIINVIRRSTGED